jgi:hypothetical protein
MEIALEHSVPIEVRRSGDLEASQGLGRLLHAERLYKLFEKQRYSVFQLCFGHRGSAPLNDLRPASIDQFGLMGSEEIMEHGTTLRGYSGWRSGAG